MELKHLNFKNYLLQGMDTHLLKQKVSFGKMEQFLGLKWKIYEKMETYYLIQFSM